MPTSYDKVAYPAGIFPQTLHARLAVLATLHGLPHAPPRTARVLEVGGGSGMNLITMAAAYPEATFLGFDLADTAVAAGKEVIAAAGLTNVELFTGDICEVAQTVEAGAWDYVIAHGVYAWVPGPVREALMALYGRALSPQGMGFISYNAMPGGHLRRIMRDRLLLALEGVEDSEQRMEAARAILTEIAEEESRKPEDEAVASLHAAVQAQARSMLTRPAEVLFHDELGEIFEPQRLLDVVAAAESQGLRLLTDGGRNMLLEGFLPPGIPEVDDEEGLLLRLLQMSDDEDMRFFRQSVFVRAEARPERRMGRAVTDRMADLHLSCNMTRNEDGSFKHGRETVGVPNDDLANGLAKACAVYPDAVRIGDVISDWKGRGGLLRLFSEGYLELRHDPPPYAVHLSERPRVSDLARANIAMNGPHVCALNHTIIAMQQKELRELMTYADGTRTLDEIAELAVGFPREEVEGALRGAIERGLMVS